MKFESFPSSFWRSLNLKLFAVIDRQSRIPNLWCLCLSHLNTSLIAISSQQVTFSVKVDNNDVFISVVYGSTN